jgi:hypothetical protein
MPPERLPRISALGVFRDAFRLSRRAEAFSRQNSTRLRAKGFRYASCVTLSDY